MKARAYSINIGVGFDYRLDPTPLECAFPTCLPTFLHNFESILRQALWVFTSAPQRFQFPSAVSAFRLLFPIPACLSQIRKLFLIQIDRNNTPPFRIAANNSEIDHFGYLRFRITAEIPHQNCIASATRDGNLRNVVKKTLKSVHDAALNFIQLPQRSVRNAKNYEIFRHQWAPRCTATLYRCTHPTTRSHPIPTGTSSFGGGYSTHSCAQFTRTVKCHPMNGSTIFLRIKPTIYYNTPFKAKLPLTFNANDLLIIILTKIRNWLHWVYWLWETSLLIPTQEM